MTTADAASRKPLLSSRNGILVLVALSAIYVPLRLAMESPGVSRMFYDGAYTYGTVLQIIFAATIMTLAFAIGVRQPVGRQWLLLGLAVTLYAIGDVIWTLFELYLGIDPFPSIADAFYIGEYVLFVAAIAVAIRGYSGLVDIKRPVFAGAAIAVVGIAAIYALLLAPYILPAGVGELGLMGFVVSILYPVGDIAFMVAPALSLALVVRQLGAGRLARPWWVVVAAAVVFALTDSFFIYLDWAGIGYTPILDLGYLLANLGFASAALVARDAYQLG